MISSSMQLVSLSVGLFVVMVALQEVGRHIGLRARQRNAGGTEGTGAVEAAVFALLGLLLAFTFGGGASRLEHRRELAILESNAIGTAWLRLDLLKNTDQPPLRELFRDYVDQRISVYALAKPIEIAIAESRQADELQQTIWEQAVAATADAARPDTDRLLLPALNEMFDVSDERDRISLTHGSPVIVGFLLLVACLSALLAGLSMAQGDRRPTLHMILFALITATTVFIILDLEYPGVGHIGIGPPGEAMPELRKSLG